MPGPAASSSADAAPADALPSGFAEALAPRLEGGELRTDDMTRALYATDASMYQSRPGGVLFPATAADVEAAHAVCSRFGVPVRPRGGGSSLAGQTMGPGLVLDFSHHMDAILEIDPEAKTARVQPGVVLADLNRVAARHGLMVGPDPSSGNRATLGGMTATNATGTHSILYGNVIHHVRRIEGVLADGTPVAFGGPRSEEEWRDGYRSDGRAGELRRELGQFVADNKEVIARDTPHHWRRNSGYRLEHLLPAEDFRETRPGINGDPHFRVERPGAKNSSEGGSAPGGRDLARLACGSEGTLMTFTEIEIGLVERPEQTALGLAHFQTRQAALRAMERVLETGPSAVELFDGVAIESCREAPGFADLLTFVEEAPPGRPNGGGDPGGLLITEYSHMLAGGDGAPASHALKAKLDALEDAVAEAPGGYAVVRRTDPQAIKDVWTLRKEGLGLLMGTRSEEKPWAFIEDASVPVAQLPSYIDELSSLIDETGTKAVYYAHASGGCLHVRPFINTKDAADLETMEKIARGSMEAVARHGGSVSSEHGDGRARGWLNEEFLGSELYQLNRRLKQIFDPEGLLNPGVIVDTPPMEEELRMGPSYDMGAPQTELDFSDDGGFTGAVELCNGNGACRKTGSGTMCPSYRATREEEHSTRGRANALRMALSGNLPEGAFTGERMKEVMDLCIQCKACKTECPSNVDMGKLKKEWLAKVHDEEGLPLRDRLFSGLPDVSRRVAGTPLTHPINAVNRLAPVRWGLEKTLGVASGRKLPPFARETFRQWFNGSGFGVQGSTNAPPDRRSQPENRVAIFPDTFTNFHTPEVGKAATRVLRALGLEPVLPEARSLCCGRTLLSKGRISKAQRQAVSTVEALMPFARAGVPVVGLEPSCTSALTDDLTTMLPGDPHAEAVAEAVVSFEELLHRRAAEDAWPAASADVWAGHAERDVLLHGHCHQKALEGVAPAEAALSLPPGHTVEAVGAGCCGMAGAFGYEKEHVSVSKDMAELKLAPAVREAPGDVAIAAPGFSCRSQIADTTGRETLHPAQVLDRALAS